MARPARVVDVEHLGGRRLRLTFSGARPGLDFNGVLVGGVFEPLNDPVLFAEVTVDAVAGTIAVPR